ncbi:tolloid-like protein 1, partial [Montipora foliosa]|uniref:tolloid-like protein 1 n=1 Tax=Montipora foliosa TaxID=591990 RepID=UPI0035F0FD87
ITVTPGSYIYLTFSTFSLEDNEDCPYDYVEVSDSNYPLSSIQIKRCGYQSPWCVWSTSNVLHVRFVTDFINSAPGFEAHYDIYRNPGSGSCLSLSATQNFCGGSLTDLSGNFTSPYYPSSYPHHLDCNWNMTVTPGSYIYLTFSTFSLQYGGEDCPYDYVEVSDSNYPLSSIQIKRCGHQSPWCVWSTSNVLHVRFVTDVSVTASGFEAHYDTYRNPGSGSCLSLSATQKVAKHLVNELLTTMPAVRYMKNFCGGNLTDLSGNFTSPYYPSSYPHHLDCNWDMTVTPGSYIYLQFSYFYLGYGGEDCAYKYVEVFDSNYPLSSIQIKRCGYQSPWCVWSTSNVLHVRFVTDSIPSASGFEAHYATYGSPGSGSCLSLSATQNFCGGNLTDLSGSFTSPYYPSSYPHHLDCNWDMTVTPGSYIYLQFSYFYLEYGEDCAYKYVEVFDSNYPLSSIQIKRCGYQSPWCVWSTSNVLHVRFVTDSIPSASGFEAHYATYGSPGSGSCLSLSATQSKEILTEHVQE